MTRRLNHAAFFLSLTIAILPAVAQNANTPASTTTPNQLKPATAPKASKSNVGPGTQDTVEYKDPEDMTTRYRPGNNTTTKTTGASTAGNPQATPGGTAAATTDAKKHIANVKYSSGKAEVPGAVTTPKDAAKTKTPPLPGPAAGGQTSATTQNSTQGNKVDSFTVKQ